MAPPTNLPATQATPSKFTASPQAFGVQPPQKSASSPTPSSALRPQSVSLQPQLVNDIKQFAVDFSDAFEPDGQEQNSRSGQSQAEAPASFGFENSFNPSASLGVPAQKLSPLTTSKSLQPGVGNGVGSSSGFESSFSPASPAENAALSSSKTANIPATKDDHLLREKSPSSTPDAETSFEDRYPSLERLHSDTSADSRSGSSPLISPSNAASNIDSSAYARPPRGDSLRRSMPSYHQASLTGGALGEGHLSFNDINGGVPLPRSSQVTGTAFKMSDSTLERTSSYKDEETFERIASPLASPGEASLPDYVDLPSPTAEPARSLSTHLPVEQPPSSVPSAQYTDKRPPTPDQTPMRDLLTGDDGGSLPFLSMQPNKKPLRPLAGSRAPPPLATKPPSLTLNPPSAQSRPALAKTHSSIYDAEWSPVEAAKNNLTKPSTLQPNSAGEDAVGSSSRQFVTSPMSTDKQPLLPKFDTQMARDSTAHGNQRSQSLRDSFGDMPQQSSKSSTYPIPGEKSLAATGRISGRPDSLRRQSSINAIVSGFEAIKTSGSDGAGVPTREERPPAAKKPQVASKPDQLKASGRVSSPSSAASSDLARSRSMYSSGGFASRASSNTPSYETESAAGTKNTQTPTPNERPASSADDQPDTTRRNVNALIAQWNQAGPPAQGTLPSALRAKPPIGSGRRL